MKDQGNVGESAVEVQHRGKGRKGWVLVHSKGLARLGFEAAEKEWERRRERRTGS